MRTEVPIIERAISVLVLCCLAGIGVAVYIKGHRFDPGLYSLRSDALKSTASEVAGKTGTLRVAGAGDSGEAADTIAGASKPAVKKSETSAQQPASPKADDQYAEPVQSGPPVESAAPVGTDDAHGAPAAAAKPVKGEPLEIALPGIKPMADTEYYSAETLFEKIDGRSGAYTGFNCQGLRFRSFSLADSKTSYVDVYEYRMDTPVNAFGIFAMERDPKGKPIDFAPDGYAGDMGFFFRQGAYYIQVIASDVNAKTMEIAKLVAQNRAGAFPVNNAGLDARRRLPNAGLVPESVTFVQDNAQGQDFLKNVFQATYDFDGAKLPFFLMVTTPADAAAGWKRYNDFCVRFGKASALPEVNGGRIFQAESFGKVRVIYQKAGEIGGVFDVTDAVKARRFVESYLKGEIK